MAKSVSRKKTKKNPKTKSKGSTRHSIGGISLNDIWPSERDFMTRPDRYKYVRKIVNPQGCVFCEAQKKGVSFDSLILYKDSKVIVMMNKYPYNNGHLLVLPSRHVSGLLELKADEHEKIYSALIKAVQALETCYQCPGMNIGMNHGAAAGAGIPEHLHWHLVPRWVGDTNFFPLIAQTKVLAESLEQTYEKLSPFFKELL